MLELARGVAQWAHGFKSGILFLFNTGEEEGLDGAHSFITQVSIFKVHLHITHMRCKITLATTCSMSSKLLTPKLSHCVNEYIQ
jgi:Zn-dependent M28 family amino/carboxypeptidase